MAALAELNEASRDVRDALYARLHDAMSILVRMRIGSVHLRAAVQCDRTMPGAGMAEESAAYGPVAAQLTTTAAKIPVPDPGDDAAMIAMIGAASATVQKVELLP